MSHDVLLTLVVPANLEETFIDWLMENSPRPGFSSFPVSGHSDSHTKMTLAEQVSGRKRQIRFEIHAPLEEARELIQRLTLSFPGLDIHFWVTPLLEAGSL